MPIVDVSTKMIANDFELNVVPDLVKMCKKDCLEFSIFYFIDSTYDCLDWS